MFHGSMLTCRYLPGVSWKMWPRHSWAVDTRPSVSYGRDPPRPWRRCRRKKTRFASLGAAIEGWHTGRLVFTAPHPHWVAFLAVVTGPPASQAQSLSAQREPAFLAGHWVKAPNQRPNLQCRNARSLTCNHRPAVSHRSSWGQVGFGTQHF